MKPTTPLTPSQIDALTALHELWGSECVTLIGAAALGCFVEMRWRETRDLDITAAIDIVDCAQGLRDRLGWIQDDRLPYRWYAEVGVRLDVLPVDDATLEAGRLQWPEMDRPLDLTGFRLVRDHTERLDLRDGESLRVAPVPSAAGSSC